MKFILFLGELVAIVTLLLYFHHLGEKIGYKRGREEGYKLGRIDADNWWIDVELRTDQDRQRTWIERERRKQS
jgi:hypothetical protein